jgi:hypothetical protein
MNAVEIEEAVSALAEKPFDRAEFPFAFLEAFGNKETTLKRLRSGAYKQLGPRRRSAARKNPHRHLRPRPGDGHHACP